MIKDLNNIEISCVYYYFKDYLEAIEQTFKNGLRTKKLEIETPDFSVQPMVLIPISKEEINDFYGSDEYKTAKSIVDKLRPIVELIEEAEPEIQKKLNVGI